MTKLSEKQGGGLIYSPAMMTFDGSTGYYSKTGVTTTGNKISVLLRFTCTSFSGTSAVMYFMTLHGGTSSKQRIQIYAASSDYSASNYQNKIQMVVKDSAGVVICRLITSVGWLDGEPHTLLASFDGDTGVATFVIDGQDADDTGNGSRTAPTTGTLETGAAGVLFVGATGGPASYLNGDIGFFGHEEAYLTNWADFMDQYGNPKPLDESTWAEWGSQPLFWNKHGDMTNNLGSAGDMTKNGTIEIGDSGAGPFPQIGLSTKGTAEPWHVRADKAAWVNGLNVIGTQNKDQQTIIDWAAPINQAGTWTLSESDFLALADGITLDATEEMTLDAAGYARWVSGSKTLVRFGNVPAFSGIGRLYEVYGKVEGAPDDNTGIYLSFNINSLSPVNQYLGYLVWYTAGYYTSYIARQVSGSWSALGYAPNLTLPDQPANFVHQIYDFGDTIIQSSLIYETDTNTDTDVQQITYYQASRLYKNDHACGLHFVNTTDDHFWVKGMRVIDL